MAASKSKTLFFIALLFVLVNSVSSSIHAREKVFPPHRVRSRLSRRATPRCRPITETGNTTTDAPTPTTSPARSTPSTGNGASSPDDTSSTPSLSLSVPKSLGTNSPNVPSNGQFRGVFPMGMGVGAWTTAPGSDVSLPLSDGTLRPSGASRSVPYSYVTGPAGKDKSIRAHYSAGSVALRTGGVPPGGMSFRVKGPADVDLTTAKEATVAYSIYFEPGFAFNHGGKLPGFYGADSEDDPGSCAGGRKSNTCFTARLMWRDGGKGELYTYLPDTIDHNWHICGPNANGQCEGGYGASVGTGAWVFPPGEWITVAERLRLNDVGKSNGEIEVYANGRSVLKVDGLQIRANAAGRIRGIMMQSFFGGHTAYWASPKDQNVYFTDISIAILEKL